MTFDNSLFKKLEEVEQIILETEDDYEFNDEDCWEFWSNITDRGHYYNDENAKFENGASKFCLIPKDEDYVIKVPFNSLWIEGTYNEETDEYEDGDYASLTDYCKLERDNYVKAKEQFPGAEKFLAETKCVYSSDLKFYIQEKVTGYWELNEENGSLNELRISTTSEKLKEVISTNACSEIPAHWFEDLLDYGLIYDEMDAVNQFLDFLLNTRINDLCGRNVGYIGDKPVLFDYSGWFGPEGSDWVAY